MSLTLAQTRAVEDDQLATAFSDLEAALAPLYEPFRTRSEFAKARNAAQRKIAALDSKVQRSFPADARRRWNEKLETTKLPGWKS